MSISLINFRNTFSLLIHFLHFCCTSPPPPNKISNEYVRLCGCITHILNSSQQDDVNENNYFNYSIMGSSINHTDIHHVLFDSGSTRFTRVVFYFSIITISLPPFLMCMHTVTNSPSHRLQLSDLMMMILKQLSCLFRQAQPSSVGGLTRNQTPHC